MDFASMTVVELRKYAKDHGIPLSAGINKAEIIARLEAEEDDGEQQTILPDEPAPAMTAPVSGPAEKPQEASASVFRPAWHNPSNRYGNERSYTGVRTTFTGMRTPAPQPERTTFRVAPRPETEPAPTPRPATTYAPRFGPGAGQPAPARTEEHTPTVRTMSWQEPEAPRTPAPSVPSMQPMTAPEPTAPAAAPLARPVAPTAAALLNTEELKNAEGLLEMHPDGYAFLRVNGLVASSSDIYVSPAQIRRFGLRAGDRVCGKVRPLREGDKYAALLTVSSVNDNDPELSPNRPVFDSLTAVYPTRRIHLELDDPKRRLTRYVDAIAPLGFGQRALLLCQPEAGKACFLRDIANAISANHPDAELSMVLIEQNPEDVTLFRDQVSCKVFATTFDQSPDNHLRMTELALERAERMVEAGRDVVLMVDSLTTLSKTYTLAAAQQGRATPGTVNPTSLYRARKLLGSARALREGGSLTVIACLDTNTGNKVDDTIIDEFREASNCVIVLDAQLAKTGVSPAIAWHQSGTRRCGLFLDDSRKEGLRLLRQELEPLTDAAAIKQLGDLINATSDNDALFARIPDMVKLMRG